MIKAIDRRLVRVLLCLSLLLLVALSGLAKDRFRIVYSSGEAGSQDIWILTLDANLNFLEKVRVTTFADSEIWPIWSPDGRQIAFRTYLDGTPQIYLVGTDGSNLRKLSHTNFHPSTGVWSRDGSAIFGLNARSGDGEVGSFDALTGDVTMLTSVPGLNTQSFDLDANQRKITFVRGAEGNGWTNLLYVADFVSDGSDFSNRVLLPAAYPTPYEPSFSPDGSRIVFTIATPGQSGIAIINSDGTGFDVLVPLRPGNAGDARWLDDHRIICVLGPSWESSHICVIDLGDRSILQVTDRQASYEGLAVYRESMDEAPVALAQDITKLAGAEGTASVTAAEVDHGSYDPDGGAVTLAIDSPGPWGPGKHTLVLTVTDDEGNSSSCQAIVTVIDQTPPNVLEIVPSSRVLWPPTHKMVNVSISVTATDNCGGPITSSIASVASNEPINGLDDGDTAPDWEITGPLSVRLRAERSGSGAGRVYTIRVQTKDKYDNIAESTVLVRVPISMGK